MEAWGREFPDVQEPEAELRQEVCQCVSSLLEMLKPEYREALRIVDLEEGKLKDLAQQSGITAENAAVRVHRARAALRRQIERPAAPVRSMAVWIVPVKHQEDRTAGKGSPLNLRKMLDVRYSRIN